MSLTLDGTLGLNSINIGANIPGTGAFTTLSASSTVSGSGFSTYLASPPAIGGTTAAGGTFTNLTVNGNTILGNTSSNTVTLNAATVTLNNSTVISAASTRTLTLNGGAGSNGLVIDASNNVGIGFTPNSGWASSKALQIGSSIAPYMALAQMTVGTADGYMLWGAYLTGSRTFAYTTTGDTPAAYRQVSGTHAWFNATSGTAGNAISFTQAMTLDASGNLVLGDTSGIGARQSVIVNGNTGIGYFRNTATSGLSADQLQVAVGQAAGTGFFLTRMYTSVTTTPVVGFSVRGDGVIYSANLTGGATTLSVDANGNIIRTISDRNLKTNDKAIPYGLAEVNKMRPIIHEWTPEANMGDGKSIGFIAQEMEEIIPEVVSGEETKSLDYPKLVAVLTAAIQELSAELNELKQRIK